MGLHRCKPNCLAKPNERWLHLGTGKEGLQFTLQDILGTKSLFSTPMNQLLVLVMAAKSMVDAHVNLSILDAALDSVAIGRLRQSEMMAAQMRTAGNSGFK
jgi:hypothetical protein